MKKVRLIILCIASAVAMALLILRSQSASEGVREGIQLCFYTVIPALFPFCVISKYMSQIITGRSIPLLRPIGRLCGIPKGCESLLLLGLLGGYPVGAGAIGDTYKGGHISKQAAQRLLSFCNNAGPSFIFGLISACFASTAAVWCLWGIQIVSAIVVGAVMPQKQHSQTAMPSSCQSLSQLMLSSVKTMGVICGYVILFRTAMSVFIRLDATILSTPARIALWSFLELTNGCCQLQEIPQEGLRFIVASVALTWGGLCVLMQTAGVTGKLGIKSYILGKILQTGISFVLAGLFQRLLYPYESGIPIGILLFVSFLLAIYGLIIRKNSSKVCHCVV